MCRYLYDNLEKMFHNDLNEEQIAQLCKDIINKADVNEDNNIEVDEFVHFISSDNCDLNNIIRKYEQLDGDAEFRATIPDLDANVNHKSQVTGIEAELDHTLEMAITLERSASPDGGVARRAAEQAIGAVKGSKEVADYRNILGEVETAPTKTNQDVHVALEEVPEPKKHQL